MMNVNFFEDQARNSSKEQFNEDWADVIEHIMDNYTSLITEDHYFMIIRWDKEDGSFVNCGDFDILSCSIV